jgi:hypothetical protein
VSNVTETNTNRTNVKRERLVRRVRATQPRLSDRCG